MLATALARSKPLALQPGWRFATGIDRPDAGTQWRKELWEYYRDRRIARPVTLRWYERLRMRLTLGNDMSLCVYVGGSFEPNEFVLLGKILTPEMVFVDGGANDGFYSLFAARRVGPMGRVLAIEPSAREFKRLGENVRLNQLANVTTVCAALGEREASAQLAVAVQGHEGQNSLGKHISNPGVATLRQETVRVTALDTLVRTYALERVDVVKLDVEGSELAALRGARETIERHRPLIQLEVETERLAGQGATKSELLALLEGSGYSLYVFDPVSAELRTPRGPDEPEGTLVAAPSGWVPPRLSLD
jgi:FkbM family methyltransferase